MKIIKNAIQTRLSLTDILKTPASGTLYKVVASNSTAFTYGEYLLHGTSTDGFDTFLFSLKDNCRITEVDEEEIDAWDSVKLIKLPQGFQLTLEQK